MSVDVLAVLVANALMLAVGVGAVALLGLARTRRELVPRLGLAYMLGVVLVGAVSMYCALLTGLVGLDLGFGAAGLFVLAAASVFVAFRRLPRGERPPRRLDPATGVGLLALTAAAVVIAETLRTLAIRPLQEFDGWVIWATKARALYEFGRVFAPVFASAPYASLHLDYPLLLPSLEAVDLRTMGTFDGTALHLQRGLLLLGFVAALWSLARATAWPPVAGVCALAVAATPEVVYQLSTNFADMPLAFFVALGVCALALWVDRGERPLLATAVVFLTAAALTKNEGSLFAVAAYVAAAVVVARRGRAALLPLAGALAVTVVAELPWRLYVAAHGIHTRDFTLSNAVDPGYLARTTGRVGTSVHELWLQATYWQQWGLLVPLALAGVVGAVALRRYALASFAAAWLALGFAGLLAVYWIATLSLADHLFNTANRTIASLVLGGVALVPVLVGRPA